jgi:lipid-A-disaccharide synthase
MSSEPNISIGIVAGEPSGDALGSGLISAVRSVIPQASFVGIGGPKMRVAGCDILYDMERIELMGIEGLAGKFRDILKIRKSLYKKFISERPDLFIGIDVPDFNISLESRLKKQNSPTMHYVSPTVWAWRGYRIRKIRRAVSHMLTLFPFEADYYRRHAVPVTCVGHPVADEIGEPDRFDARVRIGLDVDANTRVIALLPGSRKSEVGQLAEILVEAARKIVKLYPQTRFVLPFASPALAELFYSITGKIDDLSIEILDGQSRAAMEAADIVILASGTAALEAALLRRPHIVVYRIGPFAYWLIRRLRHVDHYAMPNHLLSQPVVPELMQKDATADNIVKEVVRYTENPEIVADLEEQFAQVHKQLKLDANRQASKAVLGMLGIRS